MIGRRLQTSQARTGVMTIRSFPFSTFARRAIALLYFGSMMLTPLGDALLEAASVEQKAHVEPEHDTQCRGGHDDLFCQLCRLIQLSRAPTSRPTLSIPDPSGRPAPEVDTDITTGRAVRRSPAARAPPTL